MNLYFQDTDTDNDGTNSNNWWDTIDEAGTNGYTPSGSDDCFINTGISVNDDSFSRASLTNNGIVQSVAGTVTTNNGTIGPNFGTVTTNNSGGVVTENYGTVTTNNSGGIVVNIYPGKITTNDGTCRIGTVTGGTGNLAAFAATDLSSHTAGTNVTLPSGASLTWW